mgnify:CR=1 FL=1
MRVGARVQKNEVTKLKRIGFLVESESWRKKFF